MGNQSKTMIITKIQKSNKLSMSEFAGTVVPFADKLKTFSPQACINIATLWSLDSFSGWQNVLRFHSTQTTTTRACSKFNTFESHAIRSEENTSELKSLMRI